MGRSGHPTLPKCPPGKCALGSALRACAQEESWSPEPGTEQGLETDVPHEGLSCPPGHKPTGGNSTAGLDTAPAQTVTEDTQCVRHSPHHCTWV